MKAILCTIGLHRWYRATDPDDHSDVLRCARCGRVDATDGNVAARLGWDQHTNG